MTATDNFDTDALILAIETSGRQGSVVLANGEQFLDEIQFSGPMRHRAEIFPAITGLLKKFDKKPDDIKEVYISVGPGSFTGLRIAVTIAKTYALANQAKIVAVDTLDAIAANVIEKTQDQRPQTQDAMKQNELLAVILDAKRGQFFIAVYEAQRSPARRDESTNNAQSPKGEQRTMNKILPDSLMTADEFLSRFTDKPIALIGEGLVFYKDKFNNAAFRILDEKYWNPSASGIYRLGLQKAQKGEFADPLTLTPNYIRGPDAVIKRSS